MAEQEFDGDEQLQAQNFSMVKKDDISKSAEEGLLYLDTTVGARHFSEEEYEEAERRREIFKKQDKNMGDIFFSLHPPLADNQGYAKYITVYREIHPFGMEKKIEIDIDKARAQRFEVYEKGLPIASDKNRSGDRTMSGTPDYFDANVEYFDVDFFKNLLASRAQASEEELDGISKMVTAIHYKKNILYHVTSGERVPIISRLGLLSRAAADRLTSRFYGGVTVFSSGWGPPEIGDDYVDVFVHQEVKVGGKLVEWVKGKPKVNNSYFDLLENDENFSDVVNGISAGRGGFKDTDCTILVKLRDPRKEFIPGHQLNHRGFVKRRVRPDEIIGIIITPPTLTKLNWVLNKIEGVDQKRTCGEIIDILGNNIKMPIYDHNGNLLWPEQKSKEQIVKEVIGEKKE